MASNQIQGLDAVLGRLAQLQGKEMKKAVTASLRKGANLVKKDAASRAQAFDDPSTPAQIFKEIVVRTGKVSNREDVRLRVGVKGGAKNFKDTKQNRRMGRVGKAYEGGGNVYWWRFLEFGTSKMAARPFMRPALAENTNKVIALFRDNLGPAIDKVLSKRK